LLFFYKKFTCNKIILEDVEILTQFQSPDTQKWAFEQLVKKYQQKIYGHIRKMVIDHDDANDVTQETFVKIWRNLDGFQGNSQLYTWIYRIATNECLSFLDKKRKKSWFSFDTKNEYLAEKLTSSSYISGDEIQMKLQKALLTLPDKQRLVFNMKYFDDMKYEEISAVLGTSVGALKASYHLAVKKIEEFVKFNDEL
jgi:RNA polymerase sigma factor (sigma-70 family)